MEESNLPAPTHPTSSVEVRSGRKMGNAGGSLGLPWSWGHLGAVGARKGSSLQDYALQEPEPEPQAHREIVLLPELQEQEKPSAPVHAQGTTTHIWGLEEQDNPPPPGWQS